MINQFFFHMISNFHKKTIIGRPSSKIACGDQA